MQEEKSNEVSDEVVSLFNIISLKYFALSSPKELFLHLKNLILFLFKLSHIFLKESKFILLAPKSKIFRHSLFIKP